MRKTMGIILLYVLFSVSGLLLLKIGATTAFDFSVSKGCFNIKISGVLLIGACLYLIAFVTSLIAMKNINLSIFYPISAGLGYVFVCLLSNFVLKEEITLKQLLGMVVILIGVILMNVKK